MKSNTHKEINDNLICEKMSEYSKMIEKPNLNESKNGLEKNLEFSEVSTDIKIKDYGYAWVVLAAMFFTNVLTFGYAKSFGVIYNAISDDHPEISTTMAGLMMGLLSGFKSILAPVAGAMGNLIGIRLTMFIGSFISFTSLVVAYFCTSAIQYAIVLGAFTGFSHCIIESCQVVVMSNYFDKRMSLANGIRVAGNPFGGVVYPLMLALLLQFYGLRLTFLMLAAVMTHIFICAALIRPLDLHLKIESIKFIEKLFDMRRVSDDPLIVKKPCLDYEEDEIKREMLKRITATNGSSTVCQKKKKPLDLSVLKNPVYLLFVFMAVGIPMACPLVYYYATIYSKTVLGLSVYEVSALLAVQSVLDVGMRLLIGMINNKKWYKMAHGYIFCLFLSGLGSIAIPMATGFWSLLSCTMLFSFGPNSYHVFVNVILSDQFGKESIASTWGFVRMTQGIFSFIHPTLIGYIIDSAGGYTGAFVSMGLGMWLACFAILLEPLVIKIAKSDIIIT